MRMHACMKSSRESNNRILLRLRRDYFGVYSCQYENVNGHGLLEVNLLMVWGEISFNSLDFTWYAISLVENGLIF